jgi:hypothetical protein
VLRQSTFLALTTLRLPNFIRLPRSCSLSSVYCYYLVVTCVTCATTGLLCFASLISLDVGKVRRPPAELLRLKLRRGLTCLRLVQTIYIFFRIVIHMFYLCSNALTAHEQGLTLPSGFSTGTRVVTLRTRTLTSFPLPYKILSDGMCKQDSKLSRDMAV